MAAARLAEMVRFTLGADAALVDLRSYAERQRRRGTAELIASAGVFGAAEHQSELQIHALADPIHAYRAGYCAYAGAPIRARDGSTLGMVAALAHAERDFGEREVEILRLAAAMLASLLDPDQLAS